MAVSFACSFSVFKSNSIFRKALLPQIQTKSSSWKNSNLVATNTRLKCSRSDMQLPVTFSFPKEVCLESHLHICNMFVNEIAAVCVCVCVVAVDGEVVGLCGFK